MTKKTIFIGLAGTMFLFIILGFFGFITQRTASPALPGDTVRVNPLKQSSQDALEACIDQAVVKHGAYDEFAPEIQHCYDLWFKSNAFRLTIQDSGSFPCNTTTTTTVRYDGAAAVTRTYTAPCLPPGELPQQTSALQLTPAELAEIRGMVERANIFSLKDSYIEEGLLDAGGSRWTFTFNGREKNINIVGRTKDLPSALSDAMTTVAQTISQHEQE